MLIFYPQILRKSQTIEQMMGGVSRFQGSDQIVEDYIFRSIHCLYQLIDYPILSDFKEALKKVSEELSI